MSEHVPALRNGRWEIPARFNFARDVVEPLAADPDRLAVRFVGTDGATRDATFAEIAAAAARWTGLLRGSGVARGDRVLVLCGKTLP